MQKMLIEFVHKHIFQEYVQVGNMSLSRRKFNCPYKELMKFKEAMKDETGTGTYKFI